MKVRMKIRVRLVDGTYPFLDSVLSGNGKLKSLYAIVDGKAEHHPEGTYFLRHAKGGKRVWERVGNDPQAITTQRKRERGEQPSHDDVKTDEGKLNLAACIDEYLVEVKQANAKRTHLAYSLTLNSFAKSTTKKHLDDIDRKDILAFVQSLRDAKCAPRTIANRLAYLRRIFKRFELRMPILKTDKVKYTQKAVTSYSAEELKALFAAATPEEYELFQFFLCTRAREQEVTYATWSDHVAIVTAAS
jgi:integrase/recombinase XerD